MRQADQIRQCRYQKQRPSRQNWHVQGVLACLRVSRQRQEGLTSTYVCSNRKDLRDEGELQSLMHMPDDDYELVGDMATFTRVTNDRRFSLTFATGESYVAELK